jgi:hypothetical protein
MTTKDRRAEDRQALQHLLEIYGADRTRWPARERLRFASFISEDEEARRLMAEAAALDALLDLAPKASAAREHALKERIVAAALRSAEPRFAVIAGGDRAEARGLKAWMRRPSFGSAPASGGWAAAGVLAASLVVGVMLGSTGTFDAPVRNVAEAAGFAAPADTSQLALGDDVFTVADEDLL